MDIWALRHLSFLCINCHLVFEIVTNAREKIANFVCRSHIGIVLHAVKLPFST